MKGYPLVSVIIPCYNSERWIAETVQSCLDQTYRSIEIIVVDDGSTDESLKVLSGFGDKIILEGGSNRGGNHARNRGIALSNGDYIQFLDADDLLASDKIERQMELLAGRDDCVVTAKWGRFYESIDEITISPEPIYVDLPSLDWAVSVLSGKGMMVSHGWLVPRRIVAQAGPWNEKVIINQDGEYFFRIVLQSQKVLFCPDALCYYRSGLPGSVSRTKSEKSWASAFHVVELSTQALLEVEDSPRTRRACANAFQEFVYNTYPQVPSLVAKAEQHVKELDGADVELKGPPLYKCLAKVLPWKLAKQVHKILRPRNYG
jgi:glycosyltransferase involved in cell wall biosynthesis